MRLYLANKRTGEISEHRSISSALATLRYWEQDTNDCNLFRSVDDAARWIGTAS